MRNSALAAYRVLLEERALEGRRRIGVLDAQIREVTRAHRDTPADDEHDPEGSTVSLDRERAVALLAAARDQLGDVLAALQRLEDGCYGDCLGCGLPIPQGRLEARPEAQYCLACRAARR